MTKKLLLLLISAALSASATAQSISVRLSAYSQPLADVLIRVAGTKSTSWTDAFGRFTLEAAEGDTLLFRYDNISYYTIAQDDALLDINYPSSVFPRYKADTPDFVQNASGRTRVESGSFNQGNLYHPWSLIQAKAPGLLAAKPGGDPLGSYAVQLRGLQSAIYPGFSFLVLNSPMNEVVDLTQPLVVIDGFPAADWLSVDPLDIASVEIVRDAYGSARYGARGANGVIQVRTHSGQEGRLQVRYRSYLALEQAAGTLPVLSSEQYRDRITNPNSTTYFPSSDLGQDQDWQQAISRNATSHAQHLDLSGTLSPTTFYRAGFNYRQIQGLLRQSGFDQYNASLQFRQYLLDGKLSLSGRFNMTGRDFTDPDADVIRAAAVFNPTAPIRSDTSTRFGGYYQPNLFGHYNPVAYLEQNIQDGSKDLFTWQGQAEWAVWKGLSLSLQAGQQRSQSLRDQFAPREAFWPGYGQEGSLRRQDQTFTNTFAGISTRWKGAAGQHQWQVEAGYDYQYFLIEGSDLQATNLPAGLKGKPEMDPEALAAAGAKVSLDPFKADDVLAAFWTQLDYRFRDTWFLSAIFRQEGNTRFGENQKWFSFPGIKAGADLLRLLNKEANNCLVFSLGYGVAGNLPPKTYATQLVIEPQLTEPNAGPFKYSGMLFTHRPNPDLGPERRREWNLALDASLWKGRLTGQFNWYFSRSSDLFLLQTVPVGPNVNGNQNFEYYYGNFGALRNRGWEFSLSANLVQSSRFSWNSGLRLFANKTIIDDITPASEGNNRTLLLGNVGGPGYGSLMPLLIREGEVLGRFYGPIYEGISETGTWVLEDLNGDGRYCFCEEDYAELPNALPRLVLGLDQTFGWGRFDLNFLFRGVFGHHLVNTFDLFYANQSRLWNGNISAHALEGDLASSRDYNAFSSYFVEKASFIRLDNLTLGFNAGGKTGSKSRLRLTLTAQNLLTISKYSGLDPEVRLSNLNNRLAPGIDTPNLIFTEGNRSDRGRYYLPKGWVFGVEMVF